MAAIAPSDPYSCLIRKVGYSVGLENLVARITALTALYAAERKITPASWRLLVKETYGRTIGEGSERLKKKTADGHIADFYSSLAILLPIRAEIYPQWGLDALSVIWTWSAKHEIDPAQGLAAFLLLRIIDADGDIFLNCLEASFNEDQAIERLTSAIVQKREMIARKIRHPSALRKVFSIVDIKEFSVKEPSDSGFQPRIPREREMPVASNVSVTSTYLSKILPTRKSWATDLGLFENGKITASGAKLLKSMRKTLCAEDESRGLAVWPFAADLLRVQIPADSLGVPSLVSFDFVRCVAESFAQVVIAPYRDDERTALVDLTKEIYSMYRSAFSDRAALRNQLPKYVAEPVATFTRGIRDGQICDMSEFLRDEFKRPDRAFDFTNIRGTEGGIAFRSS